MYNSSTPLEEEDLVDPHIFFPQEDTYSIEEFIQNLQSEHFIYFQENSLEEWEGDNNSGSSRKSLDQINM